jgi:hypothetical protein
VAAILILDTCAILDLVRAPVRPEFDVLHTGRARAILAAAQQANPPVRMIVSDVVRTEFQRNLPAVLETTTAMLKKHCEQYRHALSIVAGYSDVPAAPSADELWIAENVRHGERLALAFLACAATEIATNDDQLLANRRVWTRVAPAETGNNNLADCVITEIALRIAKTQSGAANSPRIVLFSSNTADFCEAKRLKPALQTQFDACALQYAKNWGEAWAATVR